MNRKPHELFDYTVDATYQYLPQRIEDSHERILLGKLDNNLPFIFKGQMQEIFEWAIFHYVYDDSSVDEFLELVGQSSLAAYNMFRMTGLEFKGDKPVFYKEVDFTWLGQERTVPALAHDSSQNNTSITYALRSAVLSNRQQDLEFLARIPVRMYDHPDIISPDYYFIYSQYLQLLCLDRDREAIKLRGKLIKLGAEMNFGKKFVATYRKADLELICCIPDKDPEEFSRLLEVYLEAHGKNFNRDTEKSRAIVHGLMSTNAIFYSVLMYKRGFTIEVDNKYFPMEIYQRIIQDTSSPSEPEKTLTGGLKNLLRRS